MAEVLRNLVLVYTPNVLDVADLEVIAARVTELEPSTRVYIQTDEAPSPELIRELASRPTLLFSPCQLKQFYLQRGRIYSGRPMQKSEQLLRLELAGARVPMWTSLDRAKHYDPAVWGEHVIVKPEISSRSRGVVIQRTSDLNEKNMQVRQFAREKPNFVVQKMVCNPTYSKARVQVFFDEILYARRFCYNETVKFETDADLKHFQSLFETENTTAENFESDEIFDQARAMIDFHDGVPMLGLDVLFDEDGTGYFIESNPGGNTWHFSSRIVGQRLREIGIRLEAQFDAFNLAAEVLSRRAIAEAV